jgi:uncharacterized protein (TIGR02145 family)/uncharacterized repeat protein (TIGR02543 family)
MKKILLNALILATLFFASIANAQVGVGVTAENIHPSAEMEVKSSTKGFLPPRMTKAERNSIATPAAGLLIYQTDGDETNPTGLYFFDGTAWKNGLGVKGDKGDKGEPGATGTSGSLTSGTTIGEMNYWDGSSWVSLKPGTQNQGLLFCDGLPTWTTGGICPGKIASLNCAGVSVNGSLNYGVASSNVSFVIPYTGGNGAPYSAQNISSTGVTGLTATLRPGSFTNGNGSVTYEIDGMPSTSGTASFELNIGGKTCTLTITVNSPSYIVTLDPSGGSVSVTSKTVTLLNPYYGDLPTPIKDGYTFTGWDFNGTSITATTYLATESNHSLVAQWQANSYLVTFDSNGGTVSTSSQTLKYGSTYGTLPTPIKEGYTFTGWSLNATRITETTNVATASNHTLVAQWKLFEPTILDIDGNIYKTVYIGTQQWMAENLKVSKYNDGTDIPNITDRTQWSNLTTGAWSYYTNSYWTNDAAIYAAKYGKLYNWYAVSKTSNGNKNVCPTGWHVPTNAEWTVLTDYLGGESVAGGKMKEVGKINWASPNVDASNESSFSGLPGGYRSFDGYCYSVGVGGSWWSSSEWSSYFAWSRYLASSNGDAVNFNYDKRDGLSVRCLKD